MALFAVFVVYLLALRQSLSSEAYGTQLLNPIIAKAALAIGLLAYTLYTWSLYLLARAKGYTGWLAALAILSIVGLLILLSLPDRTPSRA
jgi:hypothetical protein